MLKLKIFLAVLLPLLAVFLIFRPGKVLAGYCFGSPAGYYNSCSDSGGCHGGWCVNFDCGSKGDPGSCGSVPNCYGWGGCSWCSGSFGSSCTGCSTSCGWGSRTCYDDSGCGDSRSVSCYVAPPAAQPCPTTCHSSTVYVPNGSCGNTACPSNAPAAGTCPTACGYAGGTVPNGNCGTTTCAATAPCCPATVNITGNFSGAPNNTVKACTNTNACSTTSSQIPTTYSITVPTNISYTISGNSVPGYNISYSPNQTVAVVCSNISGPTITYTACTGNVNITGAITNAPKAVRVSANSYQSSPSQSAYSISVPVNTTYIVTPEAVTDYSTIPSFASTPVFCSNVAGQTFDYTKSCSGILCLGEVNDAGLVMASQSIDPGLGKISQSGTTKGWNISSADSLSSPFPTYSDFLKNTLRSVGITVSDLENNTTCQTGTGVYTINNVDFYCYTGSTGLDGALARAISTGSTTKISVLYPLPTANGLQTISSVKNIAGIGVRKIIAFVNGSLSVSANINLPSTNQTTGVMFILNSRDVTNKGDLLLDASVSQLDGTYLFPGDFNDVFSGTNLSVALLGNGSLLATGKTIGFGRMISNSVGPAADWTYEPKYLDLFRSLLVLPVIDWEELPPQ